MRNCGANLLFVRKAENKLAKKAKKAERLAAAKEEERNRLAEASICSHPVIIRSQPPLSLFNYMAGAKGVEEDPE